MESATVKHVSSQFKLLAEEASEKFGRLRELPSIGRKHWELQFHEAFNTYSRLWKYQQKYRNYLTEAGLKRWEVGEIASKIGQLYYNYYLRTSEISFLLESFTFYEAIRAREYFKDALTSPSLAIKKLRYYARFLVVCILLNHRELVDVLLEELRAKVEEYTDIFQVPDTQEWNLVLHEVALFQQADRILPGLEDRVGQSIVEALNPKKHAPSPAAAFERLSLQEAVLTSYYKDQVKFSELTLDTLRVLQAIEWEPATDRGSSLLEMHADPGMKDQSATDSEPVPANPHKYLVYRPRVSQLLLVLATACDELGPNGVLLLYISAAVSRTEVDRSAAYGRNGSDAGSSDNGSVFSDSKRGNQHQIAKGSEAGPGRAGVNLGAMRTKGVELSRHDSHLYPDDLLPFTRKPMFLIVDSANSHEFHYISGFERGQPAVALLSPARQPREVLDPKAGGKLFTLFLTAPVLAFCHLLGVRGLSDADARALRRAVGPLLLRWVDTVRSAAAPHRPWQRIADDPFLQQFIGRFLFARALFALHHAYADTLAYHPDCFPPMPPEVHPEAPAIAEGIHRIAALVGKQHLFVREHAHDDLSVSLPSM